MANVHESKLVSCLFPIAFIAVFVVGFAVIVKMMGA